MQGQAHSGCLVAQARRGDWLKLSKSGDRQCLASSSRRACMDPDILSTKPEKVGKAARAEPLQFSSQARLEGPSLSSRTILAGFSTHT